MDTKYKVIIGSVVILSAFAVGRYTVPTKVVEKEKLVYKDRVVVKKIYEKDTTKKNDKITIKLVTIKPDGTKTIETKIVDKGEMIVSENGKVDVVKETEITKETEKTTESSHDQWLLSVVVKANINNPVPDYGLQVQRRILGPFHLGAFVYKSTDVGASVGISF